MMRLIPKRGRRMAKLKRFEYIIEFEPYALQNKDELCFKSKSVQKLVRCIDCNHVRKDVDGILTCPMTGFCEVPPFGYCHYGEQKE